MMLNVHDLYFRRHCLSVFGQIVLYLTYSFYQAVDDDFVLVLR